MPLHTGEPAARIDPEDYARLRRLEQRCRLLLAEPGPITRAELAAVLSDHDDPTPSEG